MYSRTEFDKTRFNLQNEEINTLYATVKGEYGLSAELRVLVRLPDITVTVQSGMDVRFGAFTHLGEVEVKAESAVLCTLGAFVPFGATRLPSEYAVLPTIGCKVPLSARTIPAEYGLTAHFKSYVPLSAVTIPLLSSVQAASIHALMPMEPVILPGEYAVIPQLYAKMPLTEMTVPAEYNLQAPRTSSAESETMTLEGLHLAPGQTLIIDTDTLEITIDGEIRVDCWVTGGTFFQMKNGENHFRFTDNASRRVLPVTFLWADRYL